VLIHTPFFRCIDEARYSSTSAVEEQNCTKKTNVDLAGRDFKTFEGDEK